MPDLLNSLSLAYEADGKYTQAKKYLKMTCETYKETQGIYDSDTLQCLNNLAALYLSMGKYDLANKQFHFCMEYSSKTMGNNDPLTLKIMNNLANLYKLQNRYQEAEALLLDCIERSKNLLQKCTLHKSNKFIKKECLVPLVILNNLASIYQLKEQYFFI